jgi:hypothetical protein
LFTHIPRKIVDDVRGESSKRHWIIFNGDVNPEWVENLNSVLGDNKLLTLPNGERLNLPPNVRITFEVEHLHYATLATVSYCGMIWFGEDVIEPPMVYATTSTLFRQCLWMRTMKMLLTFLRLQVYQAHPLYTHKLPPEFSPSTVKFLKTTLRLSALASTTRLLLTSVLSMLCGIQPNSRILVNYGINVSKEEEKKMSTQISTGLHSTPVLVHRPISSPKTI